MHRLVNGRHETKLALLIAGDLLLLGLSMLAAIALRYDQDFVVGITDHRAVIALAPIVGAQPWELVLAVQ